MAQEVTAAQRKALVALIKKSPGNSERFYAEGTGIPQGSLGSVMYHCEVEADPTLKIPATAKSIVAAAKKGTLRWPRIAAYAGVSVGAAKKFYEEGTGEPAPSNLTQRGRKTFSGSGVNPVASGSKARGARGAAGPAPGTSGRRGAAAAKKDDKPKAGATAGSGRRGAAAAAAKNA